MSTKNQRVLASFIKTSSFEDDFERKANDVRKAIHALREHAWLSKEAKGQITPKQDKTMKLLHDADGKLAELL